MSPFNAGNICSHHEREPNILPTEPPSPTPEIPTPTIDREVAALQPRNEARVGANNEKQSAHEEHVRGAGWEGIGLPRHTVGGEKQKMYGVQGHMACIFFGQ